MTAVTDIVFLNFDGSAAEGKVPAVLRLHPQKGQDPQMELGLSKQQMARLQQAFGTYCLNGRVSQAGVRASNVQLADGSRVRFSTYGGLDYVDVWPAPVKEQDSLDSGVGILFTDIAAQPIDGYKTEPSPGVFVPTPVVLYFGQATQQWYAQPLQFMIGGRQLATNPSRRNWVSYTPGVRYCMKGNATLRALHNYTSPHAPFIVDSPTGPLLVHLVPAGTTTILWYGPATAVEGLESKVLFDPGDYLGPAGGNQTLSTTRVAHPTHRLAVAPDGLSAALLDEEKKFLLRYTLTVISDGLTSEITASVLEEDLMIEEDPQPDDDGEQRQTEEVKFVVDHDHPKHWETHQESPLEVTIEPITSYPINLTVLRDDQAFTRRTLLKATAEGVYADEDGALLPLMQEVTEDSTFDAATVRKFWQDYALDGRRIHLHTSRLILDEVVLPPNLREFTTRPEDYLHERQWRKAYELKAQTEWPSPAGFKPVERTVALREMIKLSRKDEWVADPPVPEDGPLLVITEDWGPQGAYAQQAEVGADPFGVPVHVRWATTRETAAEASVTFRGDYEHIERTLLLNHQATGLQVFVERKTAGRLDGEVPLTWTDLAEPPIGEAQAELADAGHEVIVRLVVRTRGEEEKLAWEAPPYALMTEYLSQSARSEPTFDPIVLDNKVRERQHDAVPLNFGAPGEAGYTFPYQYLRTEEYWSQYLGNTNRVSFSPIGNTTPAIYWRYWDKYCGALPDRVSLVYVFWTPEDDELTEYFESPFAGVSGGWHPDAIDMYAAAHDFPNSLKATAVDGAPTWYWYSPGHVGYLYFPHETLTNRQLLSAAVTDPAVKDTPWSIVRDETVDPVDPVELFHLAYAEDPTSGGVVVHIDFDGHLYQSGERKSWTFAFINDVLTPVQSILGLSEDQELRLFNDIPANLVSL